MKTIAWPLYFWVLETIYNKCLDSVQEKKWLLSWDILSIYWEIHTHQVSGKTAVPKALFLSPLSLVDEVGVGSLHRPSEPNADMSGLKKEDIT